jgi:hypothetical protein
LCKLIIAYEILLKTRFSALDLDIQLVGSLVE